MVAMARYDGERISSLAAADPTQTLDSFAFTLSYDGICTEDGAVSLSERDGKTDVRVLCDSARGRAYYLNSK